MPRTTDQIIAEMPAARRQRIDARYRALKQEVESLSQLRQLAGKAQADVATALKIRQPSVSKIEKQTDMYLSTLRGYVQAIGGELELVVRLPAHPTLHLHRLGGILERTVVPKAARPRARRKTRAA